MQGVSSTAGLASNLGLLGNEKALMEWKERERARFRPQRVTHGALPGRNRREKRLNAKAAQAAYIQSKRKEHP